jgi:hypothetical protein
MTFIPNSRNWRSYNRFWATGCDMILLCLYPLASMIAWTQVFAIIDVSDSGNKETRQADEGKQI